MPYRIEQARSDEEWCFRKLVKLVWTDPPFGTGKPQKRGKHSYEDVSPEEAIRITVSALANIYEHSTEETVFCVCADDRIIHDLIVQLDFLYHQGDIIWTFGLGRPRTSWWPRRHNTIATFTTIEKLPPFDFSAVPRDFRKAPKPGYPETKPMGSVWDFTLSNTDPERVGYPNQKPLAIVEPFILAHTRPGDVVADPFMGSGTTGVAALRHGRRFLGQDANAKAIKVAFERFQSIKRQK